MPAATPWDIGTYVGTKSVTAMDQLASSAEGEAINNEMFAPLRAIEPFLVDGRVHFPFWEVHATRTN